MNVMKSTALYYILIIIPLMLAAYLVFAGFQTGFIISLAMYVLIYRPVTDYYRLKSKGIDIKFGEIYNPSVKSKYFKALYL